MVLKHIITIFQMYQALIEVLTGSITKAKSDVTGEHILAQIFQEEKRCYNLPIIGHCMDYAVNALKCLILLASPATYNEDIRYIGLPISSYRFYALILRPPHPSIAYPGWDHSRWTVVRNLMNMNVTLVCGKLPASGDGL